MKKDRSKNLSLPTISSTLYPTTVPTYRSRNSKSSLRDALKTGNSTHIFLTKYLSIDEKKFAPKKENAILRMIKEKRESPEKKRLYSLYNINNNYLRKIKILKRNKKIALNDDFNLEEYQDALIKILTKSVCPDNLIKLYRDFESLNENVRCTEKLRYRNKWDILAKRVENNVPKFLVEKIKSLGQGKRIKEEEANEVY